MESATETVPAGKFFGFDYVEFWVGNAFQAASYYVTRFGFKRVAYKGLETGCRDRVTHVLKQGKIFFLFTSSLTPGDKDLGDHITQHGDGVRDAAFTVDNAKAIYEAAVAKGAKSIQPPKEEKDEFGSVITASVATYGDTIHTFVQRDNYKGVFLPGYKDVSDQTDPLTDVTPDIGLEFVDHIVGNQSWDGIAPFEKFYTEALGWHRFWSVDDKQIHTEYSALKSVVVTDADENIKMPLNEPATGKRKSQIEEFVEFYGGEGVQHIALNTPDILNAITQLRARGVQFLGVPDAYYDDLKKRLAKASIKVKEDLDTIQKLKILVDFDEDGYLLQLFTKPLEDRPTFFIEIIQRANNNGFGVGNFRALFEAIEREQALRGNL